jgi:hypothetical protein
MRLIRLVGDDQSGIIDNQIDTDIVLKKDQQIALQSASFNERISVLTVDATNNEISYTIGSNTITIQIDEADYDKNNREDLLNSIKNNLNKTLPYAAGQRFGKSFNCQLSSNDKIVISSRASNFIRNDGRVSAGQSVNNNISYTSPLYTSQIGDATDDRAKYASLVPWNASGGSMSHRLQIVNFVDNASGNDDNGVILGLSEVPVDDWKDKTTMTANEKTYYIEFKRASQNYFTKIKGGTEQDSAEAVGTVAGNTDDNDYIEWVSDAGKLKALLYRSTDAGATVLEELDFPQGTRLFPFIIQRGGAGSVAVKKASHHIDPFSDAVAPTPPVEDNDHIDTLHANPPPNRGLIAVGLPEYLTLAATVASFLGYNNTTITTKTVRHTSTGNLFIGADHIADKLFIATLSNTSYIIELMGVKIDSYNAGIGSRQNIVAVVPKTNNTVEGSITEYEPNNLYFINVEQDALVRNWRARILRIDGSPIILTGLSVITLLIKDRGE